MYRISSPSVTITDFIDLAKKRYSVRKYSGEQVPQEMLDRIIEAGMVAPTAKNLQPVRIYVIRSAEGLAKVDSLTPCRFGAPVVLLFTMVLEEMWRNPLQEGISSGQEDASIVATHMMLEAADIGLGSLWINYFANSDAEKAFGIPAGERAVLLMDIGYAAADAEPSSNHGTSRPADEVVRYI